MSYVLDTNVIVYAFDDRTPLKREICRRLFEHALATKQAVPRQVLGELLAGAHRRKHIPLTSARMVVGLIETGVPVLPTLPHLTLAASETAERYQMQYFDALICRIALDSGASHVISEDMHDGLVIDGLRIINPFAPANAALLEALTS